MAKEKKLPIAFWALLFAAIAVALVLLVGILLENKSPDQASKPTPTPTAQAAAQPQATPLSGSGSCTLKPMTLQSAAALEKSRLAGWGLDPYQLTFWALDQSESASPVLKKFTLSNLQDEAAKLELSSEQKLVCGASQAAGCIYLGKEETKVSAISDLYLERDLGAIFLSNKEKPNETNPVLARVESGRLMFHEKLGLCGESLRGSPDNFSFNVDGTDEGRSLSVIDKALGAFLHYETIGALSYSSPESPVHPASAELADANGLKAVNCRESRSISTPDAKRFVFRDLNRSGTVLSLIASGRQTFDPTQELWFVDVSRVPVSLIKKMGKAELGITPGDSMWTGEQELVVGSSNFFQTSANFRSVDTSGGKVSDAKFENAWPGSNLRSRESLLRKAQSTFEAQPLLVFADSKKTSGALKLGNQILALQGTFAPEETPRALLSKRSEGDWLILYQGTRAEPVRVARLKCLP
jgi:hypothetical protein